LALIGGFLWGREAAGDGSVVGREPVGAVLGPSSITGPDGGLWW
jgi:hypothetical protein